MSNPYDELVRYYDAEHADKTDDLPLYDLLAERFGGPVLEIGSGTGRVALHLAEQGRRVAGIDSSAAMLDRARERAVALGIDATAAAWHHADMRTFTLAERFGLCIIAYNTFAHLLEQDDQIAALSRIATHLKPGGALVLDLPNPIPSYSAEDPPGLVYERTFSAPRTGNTIMQQSVSSLDRAAQVLDVTWIYDEIGPDGRLIRTLVPTRYRYTFAYEAGLLLRLAGFGAVELYGDYDFSPYEEDSPHLLVVARRGDAEKGIEPS